MPHLIVTGPESTGKTTLSRQLAAHFGGVWVPEYPRGYLEAAGRLAVRADFRHFVDADRHLVRAAQQQARWPAGSEPVVVQDTGIEVLALWHGDKFGPPPTFLREAMTSRCPDVYILCRPDLPWVYDPLREDPHRREQLFADLRRSVDTLGCRVVEVRGFDESRLANTLDALKGLRTIP